MTQEIERGDTVKVISRWHEAEGEVSVINDEGFFYRLEGSSFGWFSWDCGNIYVITKKREEIPMSEVGDIRKQLSEMTDEELQELIRGKRKLRREQPKAKASKPRKTKNAKAKDRMADVMAQMKSLPDSEKEALLKALGG
jgi:hypothetical protein